MKNWILAVTAFVSLAFAQQAQPAQQPPQQGVQQLLQEARALAQQGRANNAARSADTEPWKSAIAKAEQAAQLEPRSPEVLRTLGDLYTETKFWVRAEEAWREYIVTAGLGPAQVDADIRQKAALVQLNLGYAAYQRQDYDLALVKFQNAAEFTPNDPQPYEWMGRIHLEQGDAAKARESWQKAVNAKPTAANRYFLSISQDVAQYGGEAVRSFNTGYDAYTANRKPEALAAFQAAAQAAPNWLEAKRWVARTQLETGQPQQALATWQQVTASPQATASDRYQLRVADLSSRYGVAAAQAYLNGVSRFQAGDRAQARTLFNTATQAAPTFAQAWYWLGRAAYEARDFAAAEGAYQRVLQLEPNNREAQYWLNQARRARSQ